MVRHKTPAVFYRRSAQGALLLGMLSTLLCSTPGQAQDRPSVSRSEGVELENRVARMERILESQTLIQMLNSIEQLRADISVLRGQLEVQGNELARIHNRQRELFNDMDTRLYRLEEAGTGGTTADTRAGGAVSPGDASDDELGTFEPDRPQEIADNTISLIDQPPTSAPVPIERVERPLAVLEPPAERVVGDDPSGEVVSVIRREFSRAQPQPGPVPPPDTTAQPLPGANPLPDTTAQPLPGANPLPGIAIEAELQPAPLPDTITRQETDPSVAPSAAPVTTAGGPALAAPPDTIAMVGDDFPSPVTEAPEPAIDPLQIEAEYRRAFSLMRQRHYDRASSAFRAFTERFPDSEYSDNAQYWLGESHYALAEFSEAIVEYEKLIENYPESSKLTHAMLKIAYSYQALKNNEEAQQRLYELIEQHPGTTASRLAQDRLEQLGSN